MKIGCVLFLVVILTVVLVASTPVPKVAAAPYPIIYIKGDGSIEPATAHITSFDNVTYTFTADINASIVIEKNDTVVDGAGYTVQGPGSGTGIDLHDRNNVTLQNIEVTNFELGIWFSSSSNNTITGNTASNINNGIWLSSSSNNTITGNTASNSYTGIYLSSFSHYNTIAGNTISSNSYTGINLMGSSYNTVTGNTASNSYTGIYLSSFSHYNTIAGNTISSNSYTGVHLSFSSNFNTLIGNNLINNSYGIWVEKSNYNELYHNYFIDNINQTYIESGYPNTWDKGYPTGGNYWSDYEDKYPNATEIDESGIWDTPYVIDELNQDNYPIIPESPSFVILPLFMTATLLAAMVYRRKRS
jgi:parallel beta-helix repeat protein